MLELATKREFLFKLHGRVGYLYQRPSNPSGRINAEMKSVRNIVGITVLVLTYFAAVAGAQQRPHSRLVASGPEGEAPCALSGAYQIDIAESDKLYSVVRGATSSVPFGEQQRFFMDLSVRLTPPDLLAIECRGREISVGSSRAPKATYLADGPSAR